MSDCRTAIGEGTVPSPLQLAIPCYQGAAYLAETLASLESNRPFVRWHLQDGGSTDGSADLARRFQGEGDTVVVERDHGQADALNRALSTMGGDIIGFLNADDLLAPGAPARVLHFFEANPEVDLVYGEVEWIDQDGRVTGRHRGQIDSLEEVLDIYGVWWRKQQWVQPEVFFRRSLWERVGPFDTRYTFAFDYDFWVRCFLSGARVVRIPEVLARFRLHPAQKSRDTERAANEVRDIALRHLRKLPSPPRKLLRQLLYDRYRSAQDHAGCSFLSVIARHPDWLLVPDVRSRLRVSVRARLTGRAQ